MGRSDSRSPKYRRRSRDRSPERRRRSRSRDGRDRNPRDDNRSRRDSSREIKREEPDSDSGYSRRRDDRGDRDRNDRFRRDRERRPSRTRESDNDSRRLRSRSPAKSRDDFKNYGLERKVKREEPEQEKWGKPEPKKEEPEIPAEEKQKVNLATSGLLTEDTNTFRGVVIKYNEPPEAKKPNARWRLYPFKGEEALQVLYVHRQSAYLIGRDHKIADIPVDHPSCSKQHAVLQYRSIPFTRDDGTKARRILPYIIDLGSANGTYLNEERIEAQRYIELKEKDMLKFGFSSREYVVMKEKEIVDDENGEGDVPEAPED